MKKHLFPLLFTLFAYSFVLQNSFAQRSVIANDSLALIDIYQSTNGRNWSNPWRLNQKVTTWSGITIENQRVVELNLNGRGLSGEFLNSLGTLSQLRTLNISSNNLTGSLQMLASLSNLKTLSMAATNYKSSYGNVPSIFGQMRQLTYLNIAQNGFTAPISDTTGFFLLTNLEELYIHSNNFVGTMQSEFGNFRNLKKFNFAASGFSGVLPNSLRNLTQLEEMYLSNNTFNSDLGTIISVMPNLRILSAASNKLGKNRELPPSLYSLGRLTYLDLSNNEYEFFISPQISNLQNLQVLLLQNNKFTQTIPSSLGSLSKLTTCNLSNNLLEGKVPIQVYYAPSLTTLILSYNKLKDILPTGLRLPSVLSYLDLSHNAFQTEPLEAVPNSPLNTTTLVYSLNSFTNLSYLDLSFNNLTQFEKIDFYGLRNLSTIKLNNNKLSGQLSNRIATISSLNLLNISTNNFRGVLPSEIGNMRSIQTFIASVNNFEGMIPNSFFMKSSSLRTLDLSENKFTEIDKIDSLTHLQSLNVSNNNLTFEDLEEQTWKITNFVYSPQNTIPIIQPCYLEIQTKGKYNQYQWFFDGDSIQNATDSILAAKRIGTYFVRIKNDSVPNLILQSENAVITQFTVPDNNFPNENFKDTTFCEPFEYELIATPNAIEYLWSTGDTTQNITISKEGIYTIWVNNGLCTVVDTVKINFAGVKNNIISSSQRVCKGELPSLLTGDSSLVNHTYLWQSSTDSVRWTDLDNTLNYQPKELKTSTYFRRKVTPDTLYNCDFKYSNVVLIEISNLTIEATTTHVSCFGGNDGKIDLKITGAFGNYQVLWENGTTQTTLKNLSKGSYKVKVIDNLGCQDSLLIQITEPQKLEGQLISSEATCNTELNDGKLFLEIKGGTEPYKTIWTYKGKTIAATTNQIKDLEPNEVEKYQVKITDAKGCEITLSDFVVRRKPIDARFKYEYESYCRLEINPKPIILGNKNGFFFTSDKGIKVDSLNGEIKLNQSNQGMYKIVYQADECSADTIFIEINEECFAGIPNTFTPNDDGTNDTWQIPFLERYPTADVEIFDRTGKILFTQKNGYRKEWDALLNGMKLAEGTYYYKIRISDSLKPIMGYISVVR